MNLTQMIITSTTVGKNPLEDDKVREGAQGASHVVPGKSGVHAWSETGMLGNFGVTSRVPSTVLYFRMRPVSRGNSRRMIPARSSRYNGHLS